MLSLDINVKLNKVKNIDSFEYQFGFERGIYALVGENAVGKSTVMAAIASTVYPKVIHRYGQTEITQESSISISCNGKTDDWVADSVGQQMNRKSSKVVFNGIYEGSIFSGTRFADMKNIDEILQKTPDFVEDLIPASKELKDALENYDQHSEYNS